MATVAVAIARSRCPLELVLTLNILISVCKETWINAILLEKQAHKVGKNREISRFLQFSRFLTNFELLYYRQNFWDLILNLAYYTNWAFFNNNWGLQVLGWPRSIRSHSPNCVLFNYARAKKRVSLSRDISVTEWDNRLFR